MSNRFKFIRAAQKSEEWFNLRKRGITATDITAITGVSPYKSPYRLWSEKTGAIEPQTVGAAALRGTLLEDAVGRYYELERGVKLRKSNGVVVLKKHPWAMASLDRTIVGEPDGLVEIKTSASQRWSLYPVPPEVIAQVQWQMLITGAQWCDVVALLGSLVFRIERVEADPIYQTELFAKAEMFRELIATNTPPSVMGADSKTFEESHPQKSDDYAEATPELERVARAYAEATYEAKLLDELIATHAIAIKEVIGEKLGVMGKGWSATWKQNRSSVKVDWEAVAADLNAPASVIEARTTVKPGARMFKVKLNEGGDNE